MSDIARRQHTPTKTKKKKQQKRNQHVASDETRERARSSGKKAVKKVTDTAKDVTTSVSQNTGTTRSTTRSNTYSTRTSERAGGSERARKSGSGAVKKITEHKTGSGAITSASTNTPSTHFPTFKESTSKAKDQYDRYKASNINTQITNRNKEREEKTEDINDRVKSFREKYFDARKRKKDTFTPADEEWSNPRAKYDPNKMTGLGVEQKETETSLGDPTKEVEQVEKQKEKDKEDYFNGKDWVKDKKGIRKQVRKDARKFLKDEYGYTNEDVNELFDSERGKEWLKDVYKEQIAYTRGELEKNWGDAYDEKTGKKTGNAYDDAIKNIKDSYTLKSVNALTNSQFQRMVESERFNDPKMKGLIKKGKGVGGEDIRRLVDAKTAESMLKGKFMSGVLQGTSYVDLYKDVGKYDPAAKRAKEMTESSGAYLGGYATGFAAQMGMGQVGKMGASAAGLMGSAASKLSGKLAGKTAAKVASHAAAEAKASRSALKTFAKNRAGELVAESAFNALDAAKMSMEDGKINKDEFKKWFGINSALTVGVGGAMEGLGVAAVKQQASDIKSLLAKEEIGTITHAESIKLDKMMESLAKKASDNANYWASKEVAGKELKNVNDIAGAVDAKVTKLSKTEATEMFNLQAKSKNGIISGAEVDRLGELQDKMLGKKASAAADNMTDGELAEYLELKARNDAGLIRGNGKDIGRLAELQSKVDASFKMAKESANRVISKPKSAIKSVDTPAIASAIRHFENTGNEAGLKKAQAALEVAQKATKAKNESLEKAITSLSEETGVPYRWVDDAEMRYILGDVQDDEFVKGTFFKDPETGDIEILVNKESPQAHQTVIGHETGHLIKANSEDAFKQLGEMLRGYADELGELEQLEATMARNYPEYIDDAGKFADELEEEITCELLGRYIFGESDEFIRKLAGEQPSALERIMDYVKKLIGLSTDSELTAELKRIQDFAKTAIEDIDPERAARNSVKEAYSKEKINKVDDSLFSYSRSGYYMGVSEKGDKIYKDAVDAGDMHLAQMLVDEAARRAGYIYDAYHGSSTLGFLNFDRSQMAGGIFLGANENTARSYTRFHNGNVVGTSPAMNQDFKKELKELEDNIELIVGGDESLKKALDIEQAIKDARGGIEEDPFTTRLQDALSKNFVLDEDMGAYYLKNSRTFMGEEAHIWDDTVNDLMTQTHALDEIVNRYAHENQSGILHMGIKMDNPLIVDCGGCEWYEIPTKAVYFDREQMAASKKIKEFEQEYKEYKEDFFEDYIDDATNNELLLLQDEDMSLYFARKEEIEEEMEEFLESEEDFIDKGMSKVFSSSLDLDEAEDMLSNEWRAKKFVDEEFDGLETDTTDSIVDWAENNGYDGVIFNDLHDGGFDADTIYVATSSNQVKSLDPVTYGADGEMIPLGARFSENIGVIRYSKEKVPMQNVSLKKMDEDYLSAVKSGDTAKQEELVTAYANKRLAKSVLRDEDGLLIPMYHSTVNGKFTIFDKNKASVQGNSGAGFYFSSNAAESMENYGKTTGADISIKIEDRANEILNDAFENGRELDWDEALEMAEKEFDKGQMAYTTYLDIRNPVYVGRNWERDVQETDMLAKIFDDVAEDYDDAFEGAADMLDDISYRVADKINFWDYTAAREDIREALFNCLESERMTFDDLKEELARIDKGYLTTEEGEIASNEAARLVAEELGYDGIVDYKVSQKFGGMKEMTPDDFHAIVFKPEQIKLVDNATYDDAGKVIPLSKRFDANNPDIRYSKEKIGGQNGKVVTKGTENLQGTAEQVQRNAGGKIARGSNQERSGVGNVAVNGGGTGQSVLTKPQAERLAKYKIVLDNVVDSSTDGEAWVARLGENAKSQKFGVAVDSELNPKDLKGAKLYSLYDGGVTIGVKEDGDIFGLAKNAKVTDPNALEDAMYTALANGGTKCDAYGRFLANNYEQFGFEPVARLDYNPEYVSKEALPVFQELIDRGIKPDVYIFKHNGDSLDEIARKRAANEYKLSTQEELDKLKTFTGEDGYEEAMKYRDRLLKGEIKYSKEKLPVEQKIKNAEAAIKDLEKLLENATEEEAKKIRNQIAGQRGVITRARNNEQPAPRPHKLEDVIARSDRRIGKDDINETAKKQIDVVTEKYGGIKGFSDMLLSDTDKKSVYGKMNVTKRGEAMSQANKEFKDMGYEEFLDKYLSSEILEDPVLSVAREKRLYEAIDEKIAAGEDFKQLYADMQNIMEKGSSNTTLASHILLARKEILTATPQGRVRTVEKEIERLQKRYADRLGGRQLVVDPKRLEELYTLKDGDVRLDELLHDINVEIWSQIPATLTERINEYRHCFMLFNVKTHGRNLVGNAIFRGIRAVSDALETKAINSKWAKSRMDAIADGAEYYTDKAHVSRKELDEHGMWLYNEFREIYDKSGSKNKFIEVSRPLDVPTVKWKQMQKLIDLNYSMLEKEDLSLCLIPAFKKHYLSWAKSRLKDGESLSDFLSKMTKEQRNEARTYALGMGEYATFRDSCAFSSWLTKKKMTFAGKKGSSWAEKVGYRTLDLALEGAIPFVKTPVNIFRRTIDYSPASIIFSLNKLAGAKTVDEFKTGVHQFCSGLTGTGAFGFGMFLASEGLISASGMLDKMSGGKFDLDLQLKAGDVSGDEYYDRELGYQDYSLVVTIGNKKTSWTLDWMQPIQASLFFGAAVADMKEEGINNQNIMNTLFAITSPLTDTSFMSSPKDTILRFQERATRDNGEGESDWGGAFTQLLLGDIPKNYVGGLAPQLMAQAAGFTDVYEWDGSKSAAENWKAYGKNFLSGAQIQRDTQSTAENVLVRGWQSAGRQIANKVPVLRQLILNPKLNRKGEPVESADGNIIDRFCNAFVNPANVKLINENKYDRELIRIRGEVGELYGKDSDDYKYFFYNMTGKPSYELANGKRMTYDEAYDYGKSSRKKQWELTTTMIDADSYKYMTDKMRNTELGNAHWIGTAKADLDVYGANYAIKSLKGSYKWDNEQEVYDMYKDLKTGDGAEKTNESYMKYYINKETLLNRSHASGTDELFRIKGITAMSMGDDDLVKAIDLNDDKTGDLTKYWRKVKRKAKKAGVKAKDYMFKEVSDGYCGIFSNIDKEEISGSSKGIKSASAGILAADGNQLSEDFYRFAGHNWNSAQAGGGLMLKYNYDKDGNYTGKYTLTSIEKLKHTIKKDYNVDGKGDIKKEDITNYLDKQIADGMSLDEAACIYEVIYNVGRYANPYHSIIDDHLKWGDPDEEDYVNGGRGGYGGYGRRGGRGGRGGSGSGSGGATPTATESGAFNGKASKFNVKEYRVNTNAEAKDYTKKSNIDEAYRKKARKLLEANRKKLS